MHTTKRPTIATVAAQAGLSVATVDRVLNARAPVNPDTAEQVFQAAEAVGYFAARLIGQRIRERRPTYRFGILLLGTAQAFYANLAQSISDARSITPRPTSVANSNTSTTAPQAPSSRRSNNWPCSATPSRWSALPTR